MIADDAPRPDFALPDAETATELILVKNTGALRATRQIRLLAFRARTEGRTLVLFVPRRCRFDDALLALAAERPTAVERRELPES